MKTFSILSRAALIAAMASPVWAAELIVPAGGSYTYTQDFNALFQPNVTGTQTNAAAGAPAWADNSTIPNWWFFYTQNAVNAGTFGGAAFGYSGNDGSVAPTLTLNSQGDFGSADRAFASPSTTGRGEQSGIIVFQNTSTNGVALSRVIYSGEVLRTNSTAGAVESIFVWYRKAATQAAALTLTTAPTNTTVFPAEVSSSPNSYYVTGWTQLDNARWTYSNANAAVQVNETYPIDASISGVQVDPGEFIAIRFSNINDAGTDGLIGIDDLELHFTELNTTLTAAVSNVVRDTSGTLTDPTDDKINFTLTVNGAGVLGPGWVVTSPASLAATGSYGVPKNYVGVPIAEFAAAPHEITTTAADSATPTATVPFTVTAPWSSLTPATSNVTRNAQGTADPFDDTWGYTVTVTGQYTGANFTSDNAGIPSPGAYGTPYTISGLPIFLPSETTNFFDGADPSVTGVITVSAPRIIGSVNFGTPAPLFTDNDGVPANWVVDESLLTQTMNNGGGAPAKVYRSQIIDLSGVGAVLFSGSLAANDTSSGNEADDTFNAQLIIDGDALNPVSLITPYDTLVPANGVLTGAEITPASPGPPPTTGPGSFVHAFSAVIPPGANSVQLVISGNNNSGSESMTMQNITFALAPPSIQVTGPTNVVRVENGPGLADDTVTFSATLTGINAGTGWTTSTPGVTPAAGNYGTVAFTLAAPLPASPFNITFQDSANATITGTLAVTIPGRSIIGQRDFGGGPVDVAVSLADTQSALWVNDPALRTLTVSAGVNAQTETVTSEIVDVSAVAAVRVTAKFVANDTSTGSNFDQPDKLKAELVIDGGLPTETIVNMVSAYDTGDGATAVPFVAAAPLPNGPADGWINGYTGTASEPDGFLAGLDEYNAHRARDEFNRNGQAGEDLMSAEFPLTYVVPASANTVQLRIQSQGISGTETVVFQELVFALDTAPPPIVPGNASMALNNGSAGKLSAASVVALATGGSGPLSISAVQAAVTARGSQAGLQDGWLVYDPAAGISGADSFTYSITDGTQTVTGTVTVVMSPPGGQSMNIAGIVAEGAGNRVAGMGIPGRRYEWQTSGDLATWTPLGASAICPANGVMSVLDPGPLPPTRFYRLVEVSAP